MQHPHGDRSRTRLLTTDGSTDKLLTPAEVAAIFRVDPKTVTRWAKAGRIHAIMTPGGHTRFRESKVRDALREAGLAYPETEH
jgi:excisionase family DNA binding protein